jgi:hypothetical protein
MCKANGDHCVNTTCVNGSCGGGTCGGVGQQCCSATGGIGLCSAPFTRCINGLCQSCGGTGQRCCMDPQSMEPIFCAAPYGPTINNGLCYCQ